MDEDAANHTNCGEHPCPTTVRHAARDHIEHIGTGCKDQRPGDTDEQKKFCWVNHSMYLQVVPPARCAQLLAELFYTLYPPDRKSTRLNSSHGYISYAVFCL